MNTRKLNLLLTQPNPIAAAPTLADAIDVACVLIDRAAEAKREALITPGSGQAMSYQEKAAQAAACLANYTAGNPPETGTYLLLDSEVGIMENADTTPTADAYEVAVVVDATRTAWLQAEAAINTARAQGKKDAKAAADTAAVQTIFTSIVWP